MNVILIIAIVLFALFLLSWILYFFNLDMKFSALVTPWLLKHYDRMKRDKRL